MCCSVLSDGNSGVCGADLNVEVRVSYRVSYLFKGASGGEHCKCRSKGDLPGGGKTCGYRHHISLGDAAVKEAVWEFLFENSGLCGGGKVGVQHHEIIFIAKFGKRVAVCLAGGDLFNHFSHFYTSLNQSRDARISAFACSYSASLGALPCQPT